MKVVLLVAGQGKRLRPYTNEKPKCKVELGEKSLLEIQLNTLYKAGFKKEDLVFITGFQHELIDEIKEAKYIHNNVYNKCNLVYSLFQSIKELEEESEIIVSYGDIIYDIDVIRDLKDSQEDISVVIDKEWEDYWYSRMDNPLDDAKTLKINSKGYISEIGKKPENREEAIGQYVGLTKFQNDGKKVLFNYLKELFGVSEPTDDISKVSNSNYYMQQLLNDLVDKGIDLSPVFIQGNFIEIDSAEEYEDISKIFDESKSIRENRNLLCDTKIEKKLNI